ncbi:MAG: cytochrome c, partial [Bdellovibrionales bacterium]|nr:cytochrome c [Bdellovibrionales bacterium]
VCHSNDLFGKKILGLTNRFPRANDFFVKGKMAVSASPTSVFQWLTHATEDERLMFQRTKENIQSVQAKKPIQLGLDTSLAHVALSLAHRNLDAYASKDYWSYSSPREEPLAWTPSESKPGVWWNVKYKNKWLLDGSVISGNPILTNILWNEIGRGSDLQELEHWYETNQEIIQDLTNAVYHSQAPAFTDFFSAEEHFDLKKLKHGQKLFNNMCAKCHGKYIKKWNSLGANLIPLKEQLKTLKVIMPANTKVIDVGTDAYRFKAMKSLKQLNDLAISQHNNVKIKVQKGYVPPPLVGIWARWPYFHNNSVPSLCALLSPSSQRPQSYWAGPANNKNVDFDAKCNGYPLGASTPLEWQANKEYFYNTTYAGKSRRGHDEGIFIKNGKNLLSQIDKEALIQFLQSL